MIPLGMSVNAIVMLRGDPSENRTREMMRKIYGWNENVMISSLIRIRIRIQTLSLNRSPSPSPTPENGTPYANGRENRYVI